RGRSPGAGLGRRVGAARPHPRPAGPGRDPGAHGRPPPRGGRRGPAVRLAAAAAARDPGRGLIVGGGAMGDRVWGIPQDEFVAAWNAATSMVDVVRRMKEIAGGAVPRWAVTVRAVALRKGG